jgi:hypothetical protein
VTLPDERTNTSDMMPLNSNPASTNAEASLPININLQALQAIASVHVIDQSLRDIAKEYRFTVEEVQEFYDKCGEMGRTRARFQQMRQELQARFQDDSAK